MITVLTAIGIIILISVLLSAVSDKSGIPMLFIFIVFGMLIGSTSLVSPFDNFEFANTVCSIALIFIMFYGGFGTSWRAAKPVAGKAVILASFGVFLTAGITGIFVYLVFGFPLLEAMLLGSVIGSTDAASVFSILRRRKLSLKDSTDSLLEMESGSNDPFSYILTVVFLSLMVEGISAGHALLMLFLQVAGGLAVGGIISVLLVFLIRKKVFFQGGGNEVFTIALAMLGYALAELISGNGYLSVYVIGIVLGNQEFASKRALVAFFDGVNMLAQIVIFFVLGLLSNISGVIAAFPLALAIMLFMTFVSRPVSVFGLMHFMPNSSLNQKLVVSWAGIRGAASIVFAIVAVSSVELQNDLFHIIFTVVLLSLSFQGGLMPAVAIKTKMYDPEGDVMKTFTDYEEETKVQFVVTEIYDDHPWIGKQLKNVFLPHDIRVVVVERDSEQFIPDGKTQFEKGDRLVLSALHFSALMYKDTMDNFSLAERSVEKGDRFEGSFIRDLKLHPDERIVMIERSGEVIIPTGDVQLQADDLVIINRCEA
jgi:cell volume regulation protein A